MATKEVEFDVESNDSKSVSSEDIEEEECKVETSVPVVSSVTLNGKTTCSCQRMYSPQHNNVSEMINGIIEGNCRGQILTAKIDRIER